MLRRVVMMVALGLIVSLSLGAQVAAAKGPKQDLVAGTAMFPGLPAKVHVNAQSGPAGEDPRGHWRFEQGGAIYTGTVTCLNVMGNIAVIGGTIDESNVAGAGGFLQYVEDNGSPGTGDESVTLQILAEAPATCDGGPLAGFVVGQGNYVVKDAQA